jgi:folate-binding Fe-S cluster repair protein YgfZ
LFPQETGLVDSFSLTKGCYPGQETVARIDTYGRVHRALRGLILDSPNEDLPEMGDKLLLDSASGAKDAGAEEAGSAEVGEVRSWAISPALERPIAFAIVKNAKAPVGTDLAIRAGGRSLTARVVEPPIVKPQ